MGSRTRNFANNVNANGRPINVDVAEFDDNKIVNDLSTLGLRVHTQENLSASNTNSQYIDVFQDSTGYTNGANTARNENEYVSSRATTNAALTQRGDGTDIALIQAFGLSNGATSFTDSSTNGVGQTTLDPTGTIASNAVSLDGSDCSFYFDGSDDIDNATNSPSSTAWSGLGNETNICVQFWMYPQSSVDYSSDSALDIGQEIQVEFDSSSPPKLKVYYRNVTVGEQTAMSRDAWHHVAWQKQGGTARLYIDGVQVDSGAPGGGITSGSLTDNYLRWGRHRSNTGRYFKGYMDQLRVSAVSVYPDGTSFASSLPSYQSETFSATGNFTCPNITSPSSVSKMGAVLTYQDNYGGVNALNTDIVLQLSADGGSNYSTATLTALPDFSTGIKMAKVNDLAVTSGTSLKYKISFANQASGSKEARIRGVSLNY